MWFFIIVLVIVVIGLLANKWIKGTTEFEKTVLAVPEMSYEELRKMFYNILDHIGYRREYIYSDDVFNRKIEKGEIYNCKTFGEAAILLKAIEKRMNEIIDNEPNNKIISNFDRVMSQIRRMPAKKRGDIYDELVEVWNEKLTSTVPLEERKKDYKKASEKIYNLPIEGKKLYGCKTYGEIHELIEEIVHELQLSLS